MIVRGPRPSDNFAQIHNAALADGTLSFKARGILAFLLSRPPGWQTSAERLARSGVDGERAIKSGLKELEDRGYLKRTRSHNPDGTWRHEQVITDQPELVKDGDEMPTIGAKQPDGGVSGHPLDTTGAFCTGGKQPDINNTEPNNTYLGAGGVVNPPNVEGAPAPTSRESGLNRDAGGEQGVGLPTHLRGITRPWLSPAALRTAHKQIELQDIPLSITKYEIRAKELNKTPTSSEWLRWLIEDEQKLLAEDRKQAKENGKTKKWFAVAGD